ncbi:BtrH N-terminal domain-containing protein [Dyadobacter sandarakinus]|uniref:BtrH N-terminal domain-containing protein n=1 Tax=Dyadobacter sandarakinus TaxID=2747268 RepID=A0ABX7IE32_9BACT|nr:BtrH N-terminal domain-containing protein [Dyadobacter sandarakinus]QRR03973.1 BtrH N-terminal domain-containing protein [Dyadobacter sandarakinus]
MNTYTQTDAFRHVQTAHCENGVTTALLRYHGLDFMSEPLAFGMGSGLFYIQIPFMTVNNGPAISFRTMPGAIFKRTCKALGVAVTRKKFSSQQAAEAFLDQKVKDGVPVGCQVGVFHLTYFPKEYRFHFNAHNLIVFGREDDHYLISDPVMEDVASLSREELTRVRFAQGPLAPKGHIYFPENVKPVTDEMIRKGIATGIRRNVRDMIRIPGNFAGVNGIRHTSGHIRKWRDKLGLKKAGLYLGQIVRMQEEIGTGGGGFRFLYGAFLEEAAGYMQDDRLAVISEDFTRSGDMWRAAAIKMAGVYKGRLTEQKDFDEIADMLLDIRLIEKDAFQKLSRLNLGK